MAIPDINSLKTRPVVVLGGGVLGRRIACTWAAAGYKVYIRDPSEEQRNAAVQYVEQNINDFAKTISNSTLGSVTGFESLPAAVENAWVVIEAVPEKLELKIDTFRDLASMTTDDCLLASNSSSYKTSEMLDKVNDPEARKRIFNTHYMMPPENRIVELMTDGCTDARIFPFFVDRLKECGMSPIVARKESTGFVFNRVWAAIKRECLCILSEGVSIPEELDTVWLEMFSGGKAGPCAMMDAVGLDTVAFIEQHYIEERGLSPEKTVDYLKANFIGEGKLGAKSGKGGLYPAGYSHSLPKDQTGSHGNSDAPTLYFLDLSLTPGGDPLTSGKIMARSPGREPRTILSGQAMPDGIDVDAAAGRIYWTNMGNPKANDGTVRSCNLDGSDVRTLVKAGDVHTPKQLTLDRASNKLYFSDREGGAVMRCNTDGTELETLYSSSSPSSAGAPIEQTAWCVGVAVDPSADTFYWTQKGPSKAGQGRIFRARTDADGRGTDVQCLLRGLPEPIDVAVAGGKLFWTDRGDPPAGNTLNCVEIADLDGDAVEGKGYTVLAGGFHEAIGLTVDEHGGCVYVADLGGAVWKVDMRGGNKRRVFEGEGCVLTGIAHAWE